MRDTIASFMMWCNRRPWLLCTSAERNFCASNFCLFRWYLV